MGTSLSVKKHINKYNFYVLCYLFLLQCYVCRAELNTVTKLIMCWRIIIIKKGFRGWVLEIKSFHEIYNLPCWVKLPLRPVRAAPPQKPATSPSLLTPTFLSFHSSHHFAWSTDWTHHLTLREWDLYWVQRKTSNSFEFMLCKSYFSNCRDSCYCRCRVTATQSSWLMISKTHQKLWESRRS